MAWRPAAAVPSSGVYATHDATATTPFAVAWIPDSATAPIPIHGPQSVVGAFHSSSEAPRVKGHGAPVNTRRTNPGSEPWQVAPSYGASYTLSKNRYPVGWVPDFGGGRDRNQQPWMSHAQNNPNVERNHMPGKFNFSL